MGSPGFPCTAPPPHTSQSPGYLQFSAQRGLIFPLVIQMSPGVWQHICVLRRKATKIPPEIQAWWFLETIPSRVWGFLCSSPWPPAAPLTSSPPGWSPRAPAAPRDVPCHGTQALAAPCSCDAASVLWMSEGFSSNPVPQHYWNFSTFSLASVFALWLFSSEN